VNKGIIFIIRDSLATSVLYETNGFSDNEEVQFQFPIQNLLTCVHA